MSTEQRKGAERACSGAGCECVEHCGSAINREAVYQRGAMRALIIHVCGSSHGHKHDQDCVVVIGPLKDLIPELYEKWGLAQTESTGS